MSEALFREDACLRECVAAVTASDAQGLRLDRTVFHPAGGGQAGDQGALRAAGGREVRILLAFANGARNP